MFRREHHRKVLALLATFDGEMLTRCNFHFGGGTRIALELDEYRDSHDIDFLCSDGEGYTELRSAASPLGYDAIFKPEARNQLQLPREMRIDQAGIRFPVEMGGSMIRVELIREARIELDSGVKLDWCPVRCLSIPDCYAEKLLANSDRWADRQVLSRDLIDLSALRRMKGPIPQIAWEKVEGAYRMACRDDLLKALLAFLENEAHQQRCFRGLDIDEPAEILAGLSQLLMDLEAPNEAS
jgi:hypothetical protein